MSRTGAIASISFFTVPAAHVITDPKTAAQVWFAAYTHGKNLMPKIAITAAAAYLYAAYDVRDRGSSAWKGYLTAAGVVVGIVPYTIGLMAPTNATLESIANGVSSATLEQTGDLLGKWSVFNLVRSLLPLASAVTGFVALLSSA